MSLLMAACRIGLVMMRTQEGSFGVSKFMVACVAWILATVFQPSPCVPCVQASMYIVCKHLLDVKPDVTALFTV